MLHLVQRSVHLSYDLMIDCQPFLCWPESCAAVHVQRKPNLSRARPHEWHFLPVQRSV